MHYRFTEPTQVIALKHWQAQSVAGPFRMLLRLHAKAALSHATCCMPRAEVNPPPALACGVGGRTGEPSVINTDVREKPTPFPHQMVRQLKAQKQLK